jgi:hypothetical protein
LVAASAIGAGRHNTFATSIIDLEVRDGLAVGGEQEEAHDDPIDAVRDESNATVAHTKSDAGSIGAAPGVIVVEPVDPPVVVLVQGACLIVPIAVVWQAVG